MFGIRTTQKQLRELVEDLARQGLCNEQALSYGEWAKIHNRQDYTCVAYSKGRYGVIASLYYMKGDKTFCYI